MTDDVVARLRDAAHEVPPARVDAVAVLRAARLSLRRRRRRMAAGLATAAVAGAFLAGPVTLPGLGTVSVPGSTTVRGLVGLGPDAPSPGQRGQEVARLERELLPLLARLRVTWVEHSACDVLVYSRGAFSADGSCAGRPGERRFDDAAHADLDRVLAALDRTGVPAQELTDARYSADGQVTGVTVLRSSGIRWDDAYVYSPSDRPPTPRTALGDGTVTRVGATGWWFVRTPDD